MKQHSNVRRTSWWTAELVTHSSSLDSPGGHDDDVCVLLEQHLPEVDDRVLQTALGGDENLALLHVAPFFMQTLHRTKMLHRLKDVRSDSNNLTTI